MYSWEGPLMAAKPQLTTEQQSSYRWVMAIIAGILMTTSFVALTSFGVASPAIAQSLHLNPATVNTYGVDSFSIGLFLAFFLGHGGIFDTRVKTGVLVAQILLIVPQFLLPITTSLWLLTVLRFAQGLMIMMLALFSLQLSGWFRPSERGRSLAFTLGAITLGGAVGGLLSSRLESLGWREMYYITGLIMIVGAVIYFLFARNAQSLQEMLLKEKQQSTKHQSAWKLGITWMMGFVQIPLTWTLFSVGGFLPSYAYHLGYHTNQVGTLMFVWGIAGFVAAFVGAFLGDAMSAKHATHSGVFRARLKVMTAANILMGLGALLVLMLGHASFGLLMFAVIVNAFMMMLPPNYWATPGTIFPLALIGAGAFGMGLISNSTSAIGPLVSSALVPTVGWNGVFIIMTVLSAIGVVLNVIAGRMPLPSEEQVVTPRSHSING
ncbi:MAG: MFS transporter [Sulfobacillus thermosulfidooxidans]|nr:MFS transporter [Sulfobacillus sp. hq2]PSR37696.1 MAG: MFS transporter [Sulfobacillus thermosulfidooxidans]